MVVICSFMKISGLETLIYYVEIRTNIKVKLLHQECDWRWRDI